MENINVVMISGNLTRDCESFATAGGTFVLKFGIAVTDRRKNPQGEWEDYPNYVDCAMFGSRAEKLQQYLQKGAKVAITGHLRWSQWEKDGQKRSKIEVIVDNIELMSSRDRQQEQYQPQYQPQQQYQQPQQQQQYQQPQQQQQYYQQPQQPYYQQQPQQQFYGEDIPF